jgi:hypothetical protein
LTSFLLKIRIKVGKSLFSLGYGLTDHLPKKRCSVVLLLWSLYIVCRCVAPLQQPVNQDTGITCKAVWRFLSFHRWYRLRYSFPCVQLLTPTLLFFYPPVSFRGFLNISLLSGWPSTITQPPFIFRRRRRAFVDLLLESGGGPIGPPPCYTIFFLLFLPQYRSVAALQ